MKLFKHIIKSIVWTVVGLYLFITTLFHIPYIQQRLGREAASALARTLETEVRIGRIDMGFLNRIIIDDVTVCDRSHKEMLTAVRLAVKIDLLPFLLEKKISVSSAQMFGTHINLYQTDENSPANYRFIIDCLSSNDDNKDKSPLNLRINTFIMHHGSIRFDRHDAAVTNGTFSPYHLNISNISTHISLKALTPDSLNIIIKKLSFREQSGLVLEKLAFKAEANRRSCRIYDFSVKMPATELTANN
ncbi:MAG: translocation/assembly module TamB, partial [Prevotella sp.]